MQGRFVKKLLRGNKSYQNYVNFDTKKINSLVRWGKEKERCYGLVVGLVLLVATRAYPHMAQKKEVDRMKQNTFSDVCRTHRSILNQQFANQNDLMKWNKTESKVENFIYYVM